MSSGGPVSFGGQPPPPYPQPSKEGGKPGGTSTSIVVVMVVVIVGLIVLGLIALFFLLIGNIASEPWEDSSTYQTEATIAKGGHFRYAINDGWEDEVRFSVNVTRIDGAPFDVYVMDEEQYENAYGNRSTGAFASTFKWENVTVVSDVRTMERPTMVYFLVVDNVHMPHLSGSATPEGPVTVDVELDMVHVYGTGW